MTYSEKLIAVVKRSGLGATELAHWLEVPRSSLQCWLKGTTPRQSTQEWIDHKLARLERAMDDAGTPFIPEHYSAHQRRGYLANIIAAFRRRDRGEDN